MNENNTIVKIQNGDANEYRHLVERYQTGLIIYCENIVKNRSDGEDIAQEAFIKAYKNIQSFDSNKGRFSTWLYRIAANCALDHLRKRKDYSLNEEIDEIGNFSGEIQLYDDDAEKLRLVIETLEPPKFAEIIKAYYWEGKSYQQIAADYDTTTNTVGTWMRRAKLQLKESL